MKDVMKKAMTDLHANDQVSSEVDGSTDASCGKYDTPLAHNLIYLLTRVVERPTC